MGGGMGGYNNMDDRILPNPMSRGGGGSGDMPYRGSNSSGGGSSSGSNYMQNQPMNSSAWSNHNRGNLDMPNLQALGINPGGQNGPSNQPNNMNNPLGVGLNLNTLPMNPAIVAAALSQWGVIGNLQNQGQDPTNKTFGNSNSGGPNNSSSSQQNTPQNGGFLSWMNQNGGNNPSGNSNSGAGDGPQGGNQPWSRQSNGPPSQGESKSNFL